MAGVSCRVVNMEGALCHGDVKDYITAVNAAHSIESCNTAISSFVKACDPQNADVGFMGYWDARTKRCSVAQVTIPGSNVQRCSDGQSYIDLYEL